MIDGSSARRTRHIVNFSIRYLQALYQKKMLLCENSHKSIFYQKHINRADELRVFTASRKYPENKIL